MNTEHDESSSTATAGAAEGGSQLPEDLNERTKDAINQLMASEGHGSDPNFIPQEIKRILAENQ